MFDHKSRILKHKVQIWHDYHKYKDPKRFADYQAAQLQGDDSFQLHPTYKRFLQVFNSLPVCIKPTKKDYCCYCKAFDVAMIRATDPLQKISLENQKENHLEEAWDRRDCFATIRRVSRETHGLVD